VTAVKNIFGIETEVPTAFDSIPVLNNQNATFYYFGGDRGETDIDDLWRLFEAGLKYAEDPSSPNRDIVSKYFDIVINRKGNGNSKVTMGLYWISPNSFLNLDSRNEWYIYESGKVPEDITSRLPKVEAKIPSKIYFEIVEKLREYLNSDLTELNDFKELSFEAWKYSTQVNQEKNPHLQTGVN
ncbi:MAG: GTPase, partial [Bacteroidales bacterium]|nr:GTPase [Bacteroidales bacterium]